MVTVFVTMAEMLNGLAPPLCRPVVASHLRVPSEDSRSSPPQGEDLREREPGEDVVEVEVVNGSDSKATSGSGLEPIACGYVGSCVQNHREARHRHEVVLIGKPCDNHGEYADCDFHASCFQVNIYQISMAWCCSVDAF